MAVETMSLTNLETQVLRLLGDPNQTNPNYDTTAELGVVANRMLQSLYARLPRNRRFIAEWSNSANLTESSGAQAFTFPEDTVHPISFYDNTHRRSIDFWFFGPLPTRLMFLKDEPPGPVRAIQISGITPGSSTLRDGLFWPQVVTGVTPNVECHFYRLPARMDTSDPGNTYADLPLEYHDLLIKLTARELALANDPIRIHLSADINRYEEGFGMQKEAA